MKKFLKIIFAVGLLFCFSISVKSKEKVTERDVVYEFTFDYLGKFNPGYRVKTQITYSMEENNKYTPYTKKFPVEERYVRVSTIPLKKHWWGKDIDVYYIFTGAETVDIDPVEGFVEEISAKEWVDIEHKNVKVFLKGLATNKEKKSSEEVVTFKVNPKSEGKLKLDVIYGPRVPYTYDYSSTIEFENEKASVLDEGE